MHSSGAAYGYEIERPIYSGTPDNPILSGKKTFTHETPIVFNPRFDVENAPAEGLQIVQVFYVSFGTYGGGRNFGNNIALEVDGILWAAITDNGLIDGDELVPNTPYYVSNNEMGSETHANATWNGSSGSITALDAPTIINYVNISGEQRRHIQFNFETYLVAKNFKKTGKDKILGQMNWGYNIQLPGNDDFFPNKVIAPNKQSVFQRTNRFSPIAQAIIEKYYPSYKIYGQQ